MVKTNLFIVQIVAIIIKETQNKSWNQKFLKFANKIVSFREDLFDDVSNNRIKLLKKRTTS